MGTSDGTKRCMIHSDDVPYIDIPFNAVGFDSCNNTQGQYRVCAWPTFSDDHMNLGPLHSKGWCLRERELLPLIVHFSRGTVR